MATSFKDFVKKNATLEGASALGGAALGNIGDLTGEGTKLKGVLKTIRDLIAFSVVWKATLVGAFAGLGSMARNLARDIGSIDAAMKRVAAAKLYSNQLAPLVGGIDAARSKLADLTAFSKKFNLPIGEVVAAQRALIVFGKGALVSGESLGKVKDIARAAGVGIDQAAMAYAGFHQALDGGAPVEDASRALAEMGVVSAQAVREAQRLQQTGGSVSDVMKVIKNSMDQASEAASNTADGLEDLERKAAAAKEVMSANFGSNFLAKEKAAAESSAIVIKNLTPVVDTLGRTFAVISGVTSGFINKLTELLTSIPGLSTAVGFLTKSLAVLALYIGAVNVKPLIVAIGSLISTVYSAAAGFTFLGLTTKLYAMQAEATARATAALGKGFGISSMLSRIYASALGLAASASVILGNASLSAAAKVGELTKAFLRSPLFVVMIFILIAAAIWQMWESATAAAEALAKLNAANREVSDSLARQIGNIKTMTDAQDALAKSTDELGEARKRLAQMEVDKADKNQRKAQADHIKDLERQRKQIEDKMKSGDLAPGSEQEKILQGQADRDLALDLATEQYKIDNATGSAKTDLLVKQQEAQQKKANDGRNMAMARADLDTANKNVDLNISAKRSEIGAEQIKIEDAAKNNYYVEDAIKEGKTARDAAKATGKTPEQAEKEGIKRQIEVLETARAGNPFAGQLVDKALDAMRSQEALVNGISGLEKNKLENRAIADAKNSIMAEESAIAALPAGDEKEARTRANLAKKKDLEDNQAANEIGAKEKAHALKVRAAEGKINTMAADSSQERLDAQVSANRNKMVAIDDRDRQVAKSKELQEKLGISAPEADRRAAAFSASSITLEDRQDRLGADAAAAVSSLARIGGGGGVESTTSDMLSLARRTAAATEATAEYLAKERAAKEAVTKP